jgi:hypothetical protein
MFLFKVTLADGMLIVANVTRAEQTHKKSSGPRYIGEPRVTSGPLHPKIIVKGVGPFWESDQLIL